MNNFGVIEVASQKTTSAPGWAYVPDTPAVHISVAAAVPGNRKRAARTQGTAASSASPELTARYYSKIRKELEALDRDCSRDAFLAIPVPTSAGRELRYTLNVRKILASHKNFANHLDDFAAVQDNPTASHPNQYIHVSVPQSQPATSSPSGGGGKRASGRKSDVKKAEHKQQQRQRQAATPTVGTDVDMVDAPAPAPAAEGSLLTAYTGPTPEPHPEDDNPLLVSWVPEMPSEDELRRLLEEPPLTYLEAAARWPDDEPPYPPQRFCDICGYWGRVQCTKCGARVCALNCLEVHKEECMTRYGL